MSTISLTKELIKDAQEGQFYYNVTKGTLKNHASVRTLGVVYSDDRKVTQRDYDEGPAPGNFYSDFNKTITGYDDPLRKLGPQYKPKAKQDKRRKDLIWSPRLRIMGYKDQVYQIIENAMEEKHISKTKRECYTIKNYLDKLQDMDSLGAEIAALRVEEENRKNIVIEASLTIPQVLLLGVIGNMKRGKKGRFAVVALEEGPKVKHVTPYEKLQRIASANERLIANKKKPKFIILQSETPSASDFVDLYTEKQIRDANVTFHKANIKFHVIFEGEEVVLPLPVYYSKAKYLINFIDQYNLYGNLDGIANESQLRKRLK